MGTPEFAVPSLRALSHEHEIVEVYTQPDRPSGRGRKLKPTPVKSAALTLGLPVRQPETLRDSVELDHMAGLTPDIICVTAFGLILPQAILDIPKYGCINVHASVLPRFRGAAPIHRAILEGDETAGVSIMEMESGLDTGPFCRVSTVPVEDHDVESLTGLLADIGAKELLLALDQIQQGTVTWTVQDESLVTYAAKIDRTDVELAPHLAVVDALRRVRASSRQAPCRATVDGTNMTIVKASSAVAEQVGIGDVVVVDGEIIIGLADGAIRLDQIRPEGRQTMDGSSFVRGTRIGESPVWECIL
jgi:methionyl-tRNA formyltransferase